MYNNITEVDLSSMRKLYRSDPNSIREIPKEAKYMCGENTAIGYVGGFITSIPVNFPIASKALLQELMKENPYLKTMLDTDKITSMNELYNVWVVDDNTHHPSIFVAEYYYTQNLRHADHRKYTLYEAIGRLNGQVVIK